LRKAVFPFSRAIHTDPNRRFEFNWQKQALSVGLSGQGFQAGDKVAVVYHLDGTGVGRKYAGV
jgi:hypothetical protein